MAKNLRVKEVVVGEGERRPRNALCWNREEAQRQKHHRDRVLEELAAELALLQESRRKAQEQAKAGRAPAHGDGKTAAGAQSEGRAGCNGTVSAGPGHSKGEGQLRSSKRDGRNLKMRKDGSLAIDAQKVRAAARRVGKFEEAADTWLFADPLIRHEFRARPEDLRIITVDGDSMEPVLSSGDRILIDVSLKVPVPPGTFVIWDGMGLVAKRIEDVPRSEPPKGMVLQMGERHPSTSALVIRSTGLSMSGAAWSRNVDSNCWGRGLPSFHESRCSSMVRWAALANVWDSAPVRVPALADHAAVFQCLPASLRERHLGVRPEPDRGESPVDPDTLTSGLGDLAVDRWVHLEAQPPPAPSIALHADSAQHPHERGGECPGSLRHGGSLLLTHGY